MTNINNMPCTSSLWLDVNYLHHSIVTERNISYRNVTIRSTLPNCSAPLKVCNCHKIVAPPQNRSTLISVLAPGTFNATFTESLHKYIVQTRHALLEITMASTTTWFTSTWLSELCGWAGDQSCLNNHVVATHYRHTHDAQNSRE